MQQNMMGQNIIITEPSSNLRALGRNALAGKWKMAVIAVILYSLCMEVPPAVLDALFGVNMGDLYVTSGGYNYGMGVDAYSMIYNSMPEYSVLSGIYTLLVSGAFSLGISFFFLAMFRRQKVEITDIFLGFERFGKALGLFLFQALFIFLWALLLFVPGIIAAIRYSQAFFILADDPTKGIRQCMDESKAMMRGNKAKFFCLNLSFIGWAILGALPASILDGIMGGLYVTGFGATIVSIIGGLFMAPVTAYIYSASAGFYEILSGHLIKETEPAPVEAEEPTPIPSAESARKEEASEEAPEAAAEKSESAEPEAAKADEPEAEKDHESEAEKNEESSTEEKAGEDNDR